MKIKCDKCFCTIDRDKYIGSIIVEEYKNIFGTYCPHCNNFISSEIKCGIHKLQEENQFKKDMMIKEVLNRIKNKLQGEL